MHVGSFQHGTHANDLNYALNLHKKKNEKLVNVFKVIVNSLKKISALSENTKII